MVWLSSSSGRPCTHSWLHPPLVISTQTFCVFFGNSHKSTTIIPLYSGYCLWVPYTRLSPNKHIMKHIVTYTDRTGEVRPGYCGTDDEATKLQKAIFLELKAGVTSLVARSAASRMLGFTLSWRLSAVTIIAPFPPRTHTITYTLCWFLRRLSPGGFSSLCVPVSASFGGFCVRHA